MRLLEQVRASAHGGDEMEARFQRAVLRYVLDRNASLACADLVRRGDGLFEPSNELFRMPAQQFWLEAFQESDEGEASGRTLRVGMLVECADDYRSGHVTHFSEFPAGCQMLPVTAEFDLDAPLAATGTAFRIRQATLPHLNRLFDHILLHPGPHEQRSDAAARARIADWKCQLAAASWFDIPLVLAFIAILNSPEIVEARPSDLSRLNLARARNRRPALLEHLEVRMMLGMRPACVGVADDRGHRSRAHPRLHYVRGHFMHRAGRSIWRSPHLRGDTGKAVLSRTIQVSARPRVRNG